MGKHEYFSELSQIVVRNNWDLPSPGGELDLGKKYHGPDHIVQEEIKEEGRSRMKSSSLNEQLIGYGLEAYGHFYRSLEAAINQGREHPDKFSEYFVHWIYSDPSYLPKQVFNELSNWLPKPKTVKIGKGKSFWNYDNQINK